MNHVREIPPECWLIQFVYDLERDRRRRGGSMVADYAADLKRYEREALETPYGRYGAYLRDCVTHCRQALGLLIGRRGAVTYQTGLRA